MEFLSPTEKILILVVYYAPLVLAFVCGCVIGSLSNVAIYRIPRNESLWHPPSHCPSCNMRIAWYDNIPLYSWLRLRGKCRQCGVKITPRYIIVELISGLLYLAVLWVFGYLPLEMGRVQGELPNLSDFTWTIIPILAKAYIFTTLLLILSAIDLDIQKLPNRLTFPGMIIGFALAFALFPEGPMIWRKLNLEFIQADPFTRLILGSFQVQGKLLPIIALYLDSLIGFLMGGVTLLLLGSIGGIVFRKTAMGGGDIKLCAMIGAFLGWKALIAALFVGFVLGGIFSVILMVMKMTTWRSMIPFGPYLAAGGFIAMLFGKTIAWLYFTAGIQHKPLDEAVNALSMLPEYIHNVVRLFC